MGEFQGMNELLFLMLFGVSQLAFSAPVDCRKIMENESLKTPPSKNTTAEFVKAQQMFQSMSQEMMDTHGIENGVFAFHPGSELADQFQSFYVVTGGDYISTILKNDGLFFRGYQNGSLPVKVGKDSVFLYESVSQQKEWRLAHEALMPFFRAQFILDTYVPWLKEQSKIIGDQWVESLKNAATVEIREDMEQYALANAFGALFGETLDRQTFLEFSKVLATTFKPEPNVESSQKIRAQLEAYVIQALNRARQKFIGEDSTTSLIQHLLFIQAREKLPDTWVMDQIITIYFAGQITTKVMLTMAIYHLAVEPGWQDRLRQEYRTAKDLNKVPLLDNFLNEVLRLYPPIPLIQRIAVDELKIGDYVIPKNALLILNTYAGLQRSVTFGAQPEKFYPERFEGKSIKRSDMCVFGAGPRVCLGSTLAMLEAKVLIGEIVNRFDFRLEGEFPKPKIDLSFVVQLSDPLTLRIQERLAP